MSRVLCGHVFSLGHFIQFYSNEICHYNFFFKKGKDFFRHTKAKIINYQHTALQEMLKKIL